MPKDLTSRSNTLLPSAVEAIGSTPLVELARLARNTGRRILAKLDYLNPGFSKKDRIARQIIEDAEADGRLRPGQTVVELTSGNTGTGLSIVCGIKGYPFVAVMSRGNSTERARMMRALGADSINVLRGVEDQKAFDKGLNNETTARALEVLMLKIARGEAVGPKADAEMAAILKRQKFNDGIPAGLPDGTIVGHKTGSITKIHHDAAIVFGPRPYVLVVLVRGIQDQKASAALIASISREIWNGLAR